MLHGRLHHGIVSKTSTTLARLADHAVLQSAACTANLAGTGDLEPLRRGAVTLHLWHVRLQVNSAAQAALTPKVHRSDPAGGQPYDG